jgi:hypothetical protein
LPTEGNSQQPRKSVRECLLELLKNVNQIKGKKIGGFAKTRLLHTFFLEFLALKSSE